MHCVGYENQLLENKVLAFSKEIGEHVSGIIAIADIHGAGFACAYPSRVGLLKNMSGWNATNFPELNRKIVLIRTPRIFPALYKVIKAVLDPITAAKIEIYSKVPETLMKDSFDEDLLPTILGGKRELTLEETLQ